MGRKNLHSPDELRELALRAAGSIVAAGGAAALSMREVARRINYTAGALYMVFRNQDDLVVQLNEQTVIELRQALEAVEDRARAPAEKLRLLAAAYIGFALLHTHRWRLIYEHRLPKGQKPPATYRGHTAAIFALVEQNLRQCLPAARRKLAPELAATLWSSVHGICVLAVDAKLEAGPKVSMQRMTDLLIDALIGARKP
jgi:AcrR family transcriptional regulator